MSNPKDFNAGVDPQKAEEVKNALNVKKRKFSITQTNIQDRYKYILNCFISVFNSYIIYNSLLFQEIKLKYFLGTKIFLK